MKRYYIEQTETGVNVWMIEHDKRADFWVNHPKAKEISKEAYDRIQELISKIN